MSVPSSRKLLERPRFPLTLNNPNEPGESPPPFGSPAAPGTMISSLVKSRPLIGRSTTSRLSNTPPSTLVVDSIRGASALTSVVCSTCPGRKTKLIFRSPATSTRTSVAAAVWNPCFSTTTRYMPKGSSGAENEPVLSVAVIRSSPVLRFRIVTFAPGTTAPVASVTSPTMVARNVWAAAAAESNKRTAKTERTLLNFMWSPSDRNLRRQGGAPPLYARGDKRMGPRRLAAAEQVIACRDASEVERWRYGAFRRGRSRRGWHQRNRQCPGRCARRIGEERQRWEWIRQRCQEYAAARRKSQVVPVPAGLRLYQALRLPGCRWTRDRRWSQ